MTSKRLNIGEEWQSFYATLIVACAMTGCLGTQIVTGLAHPLI